MGGGVEVRHPPTAVDTDDDPLRRILVRVVPWATTRGLFTEQLFGTGPVRDQGWKLHVSASVESAAAVLERVLPVLLSEGAAFKVIATTRALLVLNSGGYGASQVGKFVTVYPSDDDQAVRLACALDAATAGLPGPRVPSDRPLRPGTLVHYRYGAFKGGVEGYDLRDPGGRLARDWRLQFYEPPDPGVADPFVSSGAYVAAPARPAPLAGRYLIVKLLYRSYRGGVFRALDLGSRPARQCVVKEIWHDVGMDSDGRDAGSWGENEADLLADHNDDPQLPGYYDRFSLDGNLYLVLEYVEGDTVRIDAVERPTIPLDELLAVALGSAVALAHLHEVGIVFRDFKTDNLILTPDSGYRLIDFGLAFDMRAQRPPVAALGTPAVAAPEQWERAVPHATADVWSWGATMHWLACGPTKPEPSDDGGAHVGPIPRRPVLELNPSFPRAFAAVIDRAVAWAPGDRYPSMCEALAEIERALAEPRRPRVAGVAVAGGAVASFDDGHDTRGEPDDPLSVARRVGDVLCEEAEEDHGGLRWPRRTPHEAGAGPSPDLYDGAAGIALFLAALAAATGDEHYGDAARGAARWLTGPPWERGRAAPGLHCGEAGVGLLFVRLASLLGEPGYLAAAQLRARRLDGVPFRTLDFLHGAAGSVLFLVALAEATGDRSWLAAAGRAGDAIVDQAVHRRKNPGVYWNLRPLDPSTVARPFLGLAHGVAGIGFALSRLGAATGVARYLATAQAAADLLVDEAVTSPDGTWRWPMLLDDDRPGPQTQCHGAGGIAHFLLELTRLGLGSRLAEPTAGALATIACDSLNRLRSGLCCGLAGDGSLMIDAFQATGDDRSLDAARRCARRLESLAAPARPGVYRLAADDPGCSPDLFQGYAGVGAFHLRLAAPSTAADLVLGG